MNIAWVICVGLSSSWLLKSIFFDKEDTKQHSITNSAIYLAASLVIIALENAK